MSPGLDQSLKAHVIGFDDTPFKPRHRGDVGVIGTVFCGLRLEAVLSGKVRRDGANATDALIDMVVGSRFRAHLQVVLLQGIALAGFNVIDVRRLHVALEIPVIVVSRKRPDLVAIKDALLTRVRGGQRKWRLIQRAGPVEPLAGLYVQRCGIETKLARKLIEGLAINSMIPEPLRTAHLIAAGVTIGESRHRV